MDVRRCAAGRSRALATDDERRTLAKTDIRRAPPLFRAPTGQAFFEADAEIRPPRTQFLAPRHKKAFGFACISFAESSLFKGLHGPLACEVSLVPSLVNEGGMRPLTQEWHVLSIPRR